MVAAGERGVNVVVRAGTWLALTREERLEVLRVVAERWAEAWGGVLGKAVGERVRELIERGDLCVDG